MYLCAFNKKQQENKAWFTLSQRKIDVAKFATLTAIARPDLQMAKRSRFSAHLL